MAGLTITLPDDLGAWAETQAAAENRENVTAYIRDLIERERVKQEKIAAMNKLIEEGLASGISNLTMAQIREKALAELRAEGANGV